MPLTLCVYSAETHGDFYADVVDSDGDTLHFWCVEDAMAWIYRGMARRRTQRATTDHCQHCGGPNH